MRIILLYLIFATRLVAEPLVEPRQNYENGDFEGAVTGYLEAEVHNPHDDRLRYERSVAQYRAQRFADAEKGFFSLKDAKDPELRRRAQFNRGNAAAMNKDYKLAAEIFEDYLKNYTDDREAQENLEWAKKMRDMQPPESGNNSEQEKDSGDQKEEEKSEDNGQTGDQKSQEGNEPQEPEEKKASEGPGDKEQQSSDQQQQQESANEKSAEKAGDNAENNAGNDEEQANAGEEQKNPEAAGEPEPINEANKDGEQQEKNRKEPVGRLSEEAAERLLRRLGQQGDKIRIPVPRQQRPQQDSDRDW